MRALKICTAMALMAGLSVGCTAGVDSETGALYAVDSDLPERRDLYLDAALDARPLTEDQFIAMYGELRPTAVPVDIELLNVAAVAWLRHEDGTVSRTRDDVVALWRIEGYFDGATPIDGELSNVPGSPVYVPGGNSLDVGELPNVTGLVGGGDFVVIDFFDGLDTAIFTQPDIFNDFNNAHPGCA
jgi:hypothetical protein